MATETAPAKSPLIVALTVLAENAGDAEAAVKVLHKAGMSVSGSQLEKWRASNPEEYRQIEGRLARELEERVVSVARSNAFAAAAGEAKAIAKAVEQLDRPHISAKEAASTASDLAKVKSANIDKMLTLTGRPTAITESRDLIAIIKALEKDGVLKVTNEAGDTD